MKQWTRRDFLRMSVSAGSAMALSHGRIAAAVVKGGSPNGDIRIAVVGFRGKGRGHIETFRSIPGVRVAALCEVDGEVMARNAKNYFTDRGEKVATYVDYRKLLEDSSIDAVVIATPNHWHSLMTVWACQAGKDVYVEKPVSHNVWEGRKAVEAARKYNRIVQVGTSSRSGQAFHKAFAYLKQGNLGKILWARGLCYKLRESIGKTTGPQTVPSHIDYDLWSGPAPLVPPRRNTPKGGAIHYDWHWLWNYGGGDIANQGAHQMDICRWLIDEPGLPGSVTSIGGRFGYDDDGETPNTQIAVLNYQRAPIIFEVRGLPHKAGERAMDSYRGAHVGVVIQCEHGYCAPGTAGGFAAYDNDDKTITHFSGDGGESHEQNFITAMHSRKSSDLAAPIEGGHVSSALCHLANISHRLGAENTSEAIQRAVEAHEPTRDSFARMLAHLEANGVDTKAARMVMGPVLALLPDKEGFLSKEKYDAGYWANTLLTRQYRTPFVVPEMV